MEASTFSDTQREFITNQGKDGTPVWEICCNKVRVTSAFVLGRRYATLLRRARNPSGFPRGNLIDT